MKQITIMLLAIIFLGVTAMADDLEEQPQKAKVKKEKKVKAPKPPKDKKQQKAKVKKEKPVLEDVTIIGVISKDETKKGEKTKVKYILTDSEGNKITLPKPSKAKKGQEAAAPIKLDDYVDSAVTVTGKGLKITRKGKESVMLKQITGVEKSNDVGEVKVFPEEAPAPEEEEGGQE